MTLATQALSATGLAQLCDRSSDELAPWLPHLELAMKAADIRSPARRAAFLAQVVHESDGLRRLSEDLDYSAQRLVEVWPRHFYLPPDTEQGRAPALAYAHQPEALANWLYAHRLGNGDTNSGDGWRYRGRGLLQITGRHHYGEAAAVIGVPLLDRPDELLQPSAAAWSAVWYWALIDGNAMADADNEQAVVRLSRSINGGDVGLDRRLLLWHKARQLFSDPNPSP